MLLLLLLLRQNPRRHRLLRCRQRTRLGHLHRRRLAQPLQIRVRRRRRRGRRGKMQRGRTGSSSSSSSISSSSISISSFAAAELAPPAFVESIVSEIVVVYVAEVLVRRGNGLLVAHLAAVVARLAEHRFVGAVHSDELVRVQLLELLHLLPVRRRQPRHDRLVVRRALARLLQKKQTEKRHKATRKQKQMTQSYVNWLIK